MIKIFMMIANFLVSAAIMGLLDSAGTDWLLHKDDWPFLYDLAKMCRGGQGRWVYNCISETAVVFCQKKIEDSVEKWV